MERTGWVNEIEPASSHSSGGSSHVRLMLDDGRGVPREWRVQVTPEEFYLLSMRGMAGRKLRVIVEVDP